MNGFRFAGYAAVRYAGTRCTVCCVRRTLPEIRRDGNRWGGTDIIRLNVPTPVGSLIDPTTARALQVGGA